ncbi:hypothetical protein QBC47DRAFT_418805 [Echria macrotheca]|uniref:Uncharacterized protein n=1 Tax=Echria macrotheca TaxID=438768 RepID=A0AAJ0B1U4_9PEZI|nr:hypothetical protein QBC47DRAFT_418805 [Echria macrotheca]
MADTSALWQLRARQIQRYYHGHQLGAGKKTKAVNTAFRLCISSDDLSRAALISPDYTWGADDTELDWPTRWDTDMRSLRGTLNHATWKAFPMEANSKIPWAGAQGRGGVGGDKGSDDDKNNEETEGDNSNKPVIELPERQSVPHEDARPPADLDEKNSPRGETSDVGSGFSARDVAKFKRFLAQKQREREQNF